MKKNVFKKVVTVTMTGSMLLGAIPVFASEGSKNPNDGYIASSFQEVTIIMDNPDNWVQDPNDPDVKYIPFYDENGNVKKLSHLTGNAHRRNVDKWVSQSGEYSEGYVTGLAEGKEKTLEEAYSRRDNPTLKQPKTNAEWIEAYNKYNEAAREHNEKAKEYGGIERPILEIPSKYLEGEATDNKVEENKDQVKDDQGKDKPAEEVKKDKDDLPIKDIQLGEEPIKFGERSFSRIAGKNRYETSVEISKKAYPNGSDSVILANGKNSVDALTASSMAKKFSAPILLVDKEAIPAEVKAEIERLGAKDVYIAGGQKAISKAVEDSLKGKNVKRISGKDRYETSLEIAKLVDPKADKFIVTSGLKNVDALAASSLAFKEGRPIVLVDEGHTALPEGAKDLVIVGGDRVVTDKTVKELKVSSTRIFGKDRYETASKIADRAYPNGYKKVALASGISTVDALTASSLVNVYDMPLLLTDGSTAELDKEVEDVYIIGGERVIPSQLLKGLK